MSRLETSRLRRVGTVLAVWLYVAAACARIGHAAETPGAGLSLQWVRAARHAPQPAWPGRDTRMPFDRAYRTAADGDAVFFGSSADGKVYALDARTGDERWSFFTGGPIRLAPAVSEGRVYVAGDDGHLYCLAGGDGRLLWKLRGGPDDSLVLGNDRIVSRWPARGGPVVADGVVYYGAGIWPSEGIFVYALDAATGEVLWCNDDSGSIYMGQPHGGANAASGVSAQGSLVVAGEHLLVPTGRAVPAAFRRSDGAFLYFHLQENTKFGGSEVVVAGDVFFSRGVAFDVASGARQPAIPALAPNVTAAAPDGVVHWHDGKVRSLRWATVTTTDRKGNTAQAKGLEELWSAAVPYGGASLMLSGPTVVSAGPGSGGFGVCAVDLASNEVVWQDQLDGTPWGLSAAAGRVFVSTDGGTIYGYGQGLAEKPNEIAVSRASIPYDDAHPAAEAANEILRQSGLTEGYCVDLGCGDGSLAERLAGQTGLYVYAVDPDPENVAEARRKLDAAGLYGVRVTVHQGDPGKTNLPDGFADLVVSSRAIEAGVTSSLEAEAGRLLRPYGGTAVLGKRGAMRKTVRGPLEGAGTWTHQYCDPANTNCSTDSLVRGPLGMLWFTDLDFIMPSRHGRGRAPLFLDGRLFILGRDGVLCVDAYNGRKLWEYPLPGIQAVYDGEHLMGVSGTGSNFCIGPHGLYVHTGGECLRLDPATGERLGAFPAPPRPDGKPGTWGVIACVGDDLVGTLANDEHVVTYRFGQGDMQTQFTESLLLFVADATTGRLRWQYRPEASIRHNAIAIGDDRVYLIDRPLALGDRRLEKRRGVPEPGDEHPPGTLVALDLADGTPVWKCDDDVFGTVLALSRQHQTLVMCYQDWRFKLASERGGRMAAFDTRTGRRRWDVECDAITRPILNGTTIYMQPGAWDLLTGERKDFSFSRSYGCGIVAGSKHMMVYRSATLGYTDLLVDCGTENYGGIRPGCWINTLPAGGLVLMPDATDLCTCSYLIKASIALAPYGLRSPRIEPGGGVFAEPVAVTLAADRPEATVRYTLDGSEPTAESAEYAAPIAVPRNTTLRARAYCEGMPPSPIATADFVIDPDVIPLDRSHWRVFDTPGASPPQSKWELSDDFVTEVSNHFKGSASDPDPEMRRDGTLRVYAPGVELGDGELSLQIASSDNDTLGVAFRLQDAERHYLWAMDAQRGFRVLACKDGPSYRTLAQNSAGYEMNRWYDLRVVLDGAKITVYVDGKKDLEATDATFTKGTFALYAWGCAGAKFRSVRWKGIGQ